jgi:hypothetical protein
LSKAEKDQLDENQNITPEELNDINTVFDQFRKVDPKIIGDDGIMKV